MTPRVSVLVPTYNRAALLEECLASLLQQTVAPHQVIVIDDGSTDDTPECVARLGQAVTYLRKPNGGKPSALNLGMSHVTGDYVWVFDDDDVALPTANELRLRALSGRPPTSFVVTNHLRGRSAANGKIEPGRANRWPAVDETSFLATLMRDCFVHHNSALVPTRCYHEVGPFREDLRASEDYDMQLRLALHCPAVLLTEPTFIFRMHEGERGQNDARYGYDDRERRFLHYDGLVGLQLRVTAQLGDYLVPRRRAPLAPDEECRALLNRMVVMASKGLVDEFWTDAADVVERITASERKRLCAEERKLAITAAQQRYLVLRLLSDGHDPLAGARRLTQMTTGRALLRCFARGLAGVAWWGEHSPLQRSRLLFFAARLMALALGPRRRNASP